MDSLGYYWYLGAGTITVSALHYFKLDTISKIIAVIALGIFISACHYAGCEFAKERKQEQNCIEKITTVVTSYIIAMVEVYCFFALIQIVFG